jgi:hypothetical protein
VPGGRQAGQPGGSLRETADHAKTIGLGRRGSVADDRTHRRQPDLRAGMAGIACTPRTTSTTDTLSRSVPSAPTS